MSRICKTTKNTKTGIQIFSESRRRERILANKKRLECLGFTNAETGGDSDCDADDEEDKLRAVGRDSKIRVK